MRSSPRKSLRAAAVAEIQAIAIYDAECFWTREPSRLRLLEEIRAEEIAHGRFISEWIAIGRAELVLNRCLGWTLGSFLALLPGRWFCRVQAWAEMEAAAVYESALAEVENGPVADRDSRLIEGLREAIASETEHSRRFRIRS